MKNPSASAGTRRNTKRRLAPIAALATASLVAGGVVYASNVNSTPAQAAQIDLSEEQSEALAAVLTGDLGSIDLADLVYAQSAFDAAPGPNQGELDADLLDEVLQVNLGTLNVPLIGVAGSGALLDLGDLGAVFAQGTSVDAVSSRAETSTIGQNGAVDLDATLADTSSETTLDLTALFEQLGLDGVTDAVLDEANLTLGALASIAEISEGGVIETGADDVPGEYVIAGSHVRLHSDAVGNLLGLVDTTLGGVGTALAASSARPASSIS